MGSAVRPVVSRPDELSSAALDTKVGARPPTLMILSSRMPFPTRRGDAMTLFEIVKRLHRLAAVHLLVLSDEVAASDAARIVAANVASLTVIPFPAWTGWTRAVGSVMTMTPSQVSYFRLRRARLAVENATTSINPDIIVCHGIRVAQYVSGLVAQDRILFAVDSIGRELRARARFAPWWAGPLISWEARRVDRYTSSISERFTQVVVVAEPDARDLERIGCARVRVVPQGISFDPSAEVRARPARPTVVFSGNLSVHHNVDAAIYAATAVWPQVIADIPDARLRIVGSSPSRRLDRIRSSPGIDIVPDPPSMSAILRAADVVLAPMRFGTGVQNKVLEALAIGVPVVTTEAVASAFDPDVRCAIRTGGTPAELATAVVSLLRRREDPPNPVMESARALVMARYRWSHLVSAALGHHAHRFASPNEDAIHSDV
jgi:polysaccharide biosynthesis protein PslH